MANDNEKQARECTSGSKEGLDLSDNQKRISDMKAETDSRPQTESLDGGAFEEAPFNPAKEIEGARLKDFESSQYQGEAFVPESLDFVPISKAQATGLIIKHHYLHRRCPISLAYGIKVGDKVRGVLTIGKPNSYSACVGVTGGALMDVKKDKGRWRDVFELNRLWVSDELPPNTESRFIGWVLRELKRDYPNLILLSYADGEQNHVGYVYQATNWIYTGLSTKFEDRTLAGYNDHRSVPKGKLQGPNVICKRRSRKHRYVMFLTRKDRGLLAWKQLPYPKRSAQ